MLIGTQFSNLYTSVIPPTKGRVVHHGHEIKPDHDPNGAMVILLLLWLTRWCTCDSTKSPDREGLSVR